MQTIRTQNKGIGISYHPTATVKSCYSTESGIERYIMCVNLEVFIGILLQKMLHGKFTLENIVSISE